MKLSMHILKGRRSGDMFKRCVASAELSGIDYTVINNLKKNILVGRRRGFDCDGTHITMLDDDDETLLTRDKGIELMLLNKPAIFTNSYVIGINGGINVPEYIREWRIEHEQNRLCRPHATMIIEKDFAVHTLNEVAAQIKAHNFHPNFTDFIFRCIISTTVGWHYDTALTYKWYIHPGGHHVLNRSEFVDIRRHFFGKK
jgi:hypothetical protein